MKELPKVYEPQQVEGRIYRMWMDNDCFKATPDPDKKPFSIVMPPPNVTGQLHMGHAMDATLQDILTRFKRMQGYEALWLPGTDHAGIATQIKVEEELRTKEGLTRYDLGREKFLQRVWEWKEKYGNRIVEQQKKMGASCDWSRSRFTMDEGCSRAVRETFCELYDKGLIYKGSRIINWCPHCLTALSDAEVEYVDKPGHLWYIRYPLADGSGDIVVATTRPETMMGDTGVAVNPEDEKFKHLIGKKCILPIMNREIPIVGDEYCEIGFGTGAVKMTPAHDPNDFEVGLRHNLEVIRVIADDGTINENGGPYNGMDRYECRKAIVKDLEEQGYLVKTEPYSHNVGTCYRCHNDVEPLISAQWFVKMEPLAKEAIRVVQDGTIKFVPERFTKTYINWMENVHDWCISRQLWWGHQIPAWYCDDCGHINVSREDPSEVRKVRQHAPHPRGGRARHLVLLRALAVLHARLARSGLRRPQVLVSHVRHGHGLRHHLLLGRAHDLLRHGADEEGAVQDGVHPRPRPRRQGPQDVQVPRQRHRPAGDGGEVRRGRAALQPHHRQLSRQRHALLR